MLKRTLKRVSSRIEERNRNAVFKRNHSKEIGGRRWNIFKIIVDEYDAAMEEPELTWFEKEMNMLDYDWVRYERGFYKSDIPWYTMDDDVDTEPNESEKHATNCCESSDSTSSGSKKVVSDCIRFHSGTSYDKCKYEVIDELKRVCEQLNEIDDRIEKIGLERLSKKLLMQSKCGGCNDRDSDKPDYLPHTSVDNLEISELQQLIPSQKWGGGNL